MYQAYKWWVIYIVSYFELTKTTIDIALYNINFVNENISFISAYTWDATFDICIIKVELNALLNLILLFNLALVCSVKQNMK